MEIAAAAAADSSLNSGPVHAGKRTHFLFPEMFQGDYSHWEFLSLHIEKKRERTSQGECVTVSKCKKVSINQLFSGNVIINHDEG